ncbi:MAG: hypothetical protein GY851_00440 [bacterium]|nr:hypothetical protein [bacterium]
MQKIHHIALIAAIPIILSTGCAYRQALVTQRGVMLDTQHAVSLRVERAGGGEFTVAAGVDPLLIAVAARGWAATRAANPEAWRRAFWKDMGLGALGVVAGAVVADNWDSGSGVETAPATSTELPPGNSVGTIVVNSGGAPVKIEQTIYAPVPVVEPEAEEL